MQILFLRRDWYLDYLKNPYNLRIKDNHFKNKAQDLHRDFSKQNTQVANEHMQRRSTSLAIRETRIKTTMRDHFTPIRMGNQSRAITSVTQ